MPPCVVITVVPEEKEKKPEVSAPEEKPVREMPAEAPKETPTIEERPPEVPKEEVKPKEAKKEKPKEEVKSPLPQKGAVPLEAGKAPSLPKAKKRKKIRSLTLAEVEEKLKTTETNMGGTLSRYAQNLLQRKEELLKRIEETKEETKEEAQEKV